MSRKVVIGQVNKNLPVFDAKKFKWSGSLGHAYASDLGIPPGVTPGGRVFKDSADFGFVVASPVSGKTLLFVLTEESASGWVYRANAERPIVITIEND